jgi:hypothetical protein
VPGCERLLRQEADHSRQTDYRQEGRKVSFVLVMTGLPACTSETALLVVTRSMPMIGSITSPFPKTVSTVIAGVPSLMSTECRSGFLS